VQFHTLDYDASQGGRTFKDAEGDAMTYEVIVGSSPGPMLMDPPPGVTVTGTRVTGAPQTLSPIFVTIKATDARGAGPQFDWFAITVDPNGAPRVANAATPVLVQTGQAVSIDTTLGGTRFSDPEGDPLTYRVTTRGYPGISVNGTQLSGSERDGAVEVTVTAEDHTAHPPATCFSSALDCRQSSAPVDALRLQGRVAALAVRVQDLERGSDTRWDTQMDHRTTDLARRWVVCCFTTSAFPCVSWHARHATSAPQFASPGASTLCHRHSTETQCNGAGQCPVQHSRGWFRTCEPGESARPRGGDDADEMGAHPPSLESKLLIPPSIHRSKQRLARAKSPRSAHFWRSSSMSRR
jgi:hypothetical protein